MRADKGPLVLAAVVSVVWMGLGWNYYTTMAEMSEEIDSKEH